MHGAKQQKKQQGTSHTFIGFNCVIVLYFVQLSQNAWTDNCVESGRECHLLNIDARFAKPCKFKASATDGARALRRVKDPDIFKIIEVSFSYLFFVMLVPGYHEVPNRLQ